MKLSFNASLHSDTGQPITFRAIDERDLPFLSQVYSSTRREEMQQVGWPAEQIASFLQSQFNAQHAHYQQYYPDASFDLVLLAGEPIGRLYLDVLNDDDIRIIDIALLPQYRGRGIGYTLLRCILDQAANEDKCVSIHVEKFNPALQLYHRLGFTEQEDRGVYLFLKWQQPSAREQGMRRHA